MFENDFGRKSVFYLLRFDLDDGLVILFLRLEDLLLFVPRVDLTRRALQRKTLSCSSNTNSLVEDDYLHFELLLTPRIVLREEV